MFCLSEQQETRAERGFNSAAQKCSSEMRLFELSVWIKEKSEDEEPEPKRSRGRPKKSVMYKTSKIAWC